MSKSKARIERIEHQLQPPKITLHILLPGEQPPPAEPGDEVIEITLGGFSDKEL